MSHTTSKSILATARSSLALPSQSLPPLACSKSGSALFSVIQKSSKRCLPQGTTLMRLLKHDMHMKSMPFDIWAKGTWNLGSIKSWQQAVGQRIELDCGLRIDKKHALKKSQRISEHVKVALNTFTQGWNQILWLVVLWACNSSDVNITRVCEIKRKQQTVPVLSSDSSSLFGLNFTGRKTKEHPENRRFFAHPLHDQSHESRLWTYGYMSPGKTVRALHWKISRLSKAIGKNNALHLLHQTHSGSPPFQTRISKQSVTSWGGFSWVQHDRPTEPPQIRWPCKLRVNCTFAQTSHSRETVSNGSKKHSSAPSENEEKQTKKQTVFEMRLHFYR